MSDIAAGLRQAFDSQMSLCDLLEEIADSLPSRLDRQQCLLTARMIAPLLRRAHLAEENHLFPQVAADYCDGPLVIERLRLEHIEDECFAEEVQFELMQMGRGQPVLAPEATGEMLRGFFRGIRRHVRHELDLLATIERGRLVS